MFEELDYLPRQTPVGLLDYSEKLGLPTFLEDSPIQGLPSVTNYNLASDDQIVLASILDRFLGKSDNDIFLRWLLLWPFASQVYLASASTSVAFSHSLDGSGNTIFRTINDSLALVNSPEGPKTHSEVNEATVTFFHANSININFAVSGSTDLAFGHSTAGSGKTHDELVEDDLLLVNDPEGDRGQFINDALAFGHSVVSAGSDYNVSATTSVSFGQVLNRTYDFSVSTTIAFSHSAIRGPTVTARPEDCSITFSGSASAEKLRITSDTVTFTHTATREGFARNFSTSLAITFSHAAYADTSKVSCDNYSTPLGIRSQLTLSYPVNSPTSTLNLRIPKFGDTKRLTPKFKIKRTMAGFPRVNRVTSWPQIEVLRFTIEALTQTQRNDFLTFIELTSAAPDNIRLLDHENVNWSGIIIDPTVETITEGRGCQYQIAFSFRGVRL